MSKEAIREKHLFKNGLSVNKSPVGKSIQKAAYDAMDEYAKESSIGFAEWIAKNNWWNDSGMWTQDVNNIRQYTTEQLYTLYLQTIK